ncbi:site-specific integrase [Bradyrhizobium sp. AUGA SZCCT0240]|uniref:site-specific integrase n=1 Tax=Bradyrhizobium sp. AUGA SZCCT0240 TaxID=2807669 RepID=UPI001BAD873F|nr:site-specific integrase [Bradyrhizobium sp. AUGA SZCCT0240]MBR1255209.1 site-specific integrase [Bradyrhizobium sp. AUGA SZCCT0240]
MMGLIKDRHGTYYAQRRVPDRLQEAVARVLNSDKPKQVFLKKSLGTKVLKAANVAATHVLADFNRTLASAEALLKERPLASLLTEAQIRRMAEAYYASVLHSDEEERQEGTGSEPIFQSIAQQLTAAGVEFRTPFRVGQTPEAGLSDREVFKREHALSEALPDAMSALAKGDITHVRLDADELLEAFQINLDPKSLSYRQLGMAVLRARVRALKDIERRNAGEPIETPVFSLDPVGAPTAGSTLSAALEGWKKERERPEGTVHEYSRAVDMFIQLHGNLTILEIKRSHARTFREAVQLVPKSRKGSLLKASLPELSEYGRKHPTAAKVSAGTVNKQLGAVQAIAGWGYHHGLVPEDASWADPFSEMRLEEEQSERAPFDAKDLQTIFNAPLFTERKIPEGAKGDAGVWLPLLALFGGSRQAEFAGLRVADIREDEKARFPLMWFIRDRKAGRRLKTKTSERVVPVHPELIELGFLEFVAARRKADGEQAWLFPTVAPDQKRALSNWAKWWGRYLRTHAGVKDTNKVFHSFRHGFQDALRRATPDEELRDALAGRSSGKSVSRTYGARAMLERWGGDTLSNTIEKISYPGLDLTRVRPMANSNTSRTKKRK